MITKTHKGDLGLGVPEKKKKKKKKVVKEPETQYSVLNSDNYFTEICPTRALSPSKSVVLGQASEMPVLKKKKKKKGHSTLCEEHLEPETMLCAGRTEKLSSPRKQALGSSEFQGGEKKKKRKSLRPLAMPSGSRVKTSLDNRQGEEVTRVVKKPKKHKKEKAAQEAAAFSAKDPWFCEAGDTPSTCSVGKDGKEQAASGQKRKQGSPRECNVKVKKKKKIHQKGDTSLEGHLERSKSLESSPRKGSKKPVKVEAPEYIPIGHNPKSPAKKKMKSKKKVEPPGIEEPALKRNKKKKGKESRVAEEPWEEDPDTDLEVVLEKKGNMDEAHIDQVRRKALQEEIDRESGKTEASEPRKWTGTQFGQWDTASFENEEQKLKFLKLMGGFKNGAPSFSRPSNTIGRPNMALSKKAADTLQQNLQQDYDRAMSWKYKRGTGLGFSTTPDKTFYIDRNASKSIKFED
ncbi:lysine-rich nucleolar protein 1 isoform X1 [Ailuropoda melanoleuca]|uniref:Lysine rich nucleolar protein 1 n=1 Tax=Ailuropoda melanoleuca TaxID=9646 RepID=A0A7N5PAR0_AILME|nr:lysine-rich nucleolar protein 1 isoform X1 [Ailuropoda melanoleuca]XP_034526197.1 lysine-rich nucleolar protein 1 isoform X1 [Ailuropoda melanoleuca]XP_034526198.1 lysine-rich nucleolar protein 1 isoform X1 [Ailuropoda melanoleuca]XP_034526200.1 lysine-rich nucleolar protein 1 isoform X1 [Ailuropoda melanoleuca]